MYIPRIWPNPDLYVTAIKGERTNQKTLIYTIYSVFNWLQWVILVELVKENPASQRYLGKAEIFLCPFSDNCGVYPLIVHQNSTSSDFLFIFLNNSIDE